MIVPHREILQVSQALITKLKAWPGRVGIDWSSPRWQAAAMRPQPEI